MDSIVINNKNYVNADYVLKNAPIYSKTVGSSRNLIRKKNINCHNFIYSKFENNVWIVSNGKSVKFDKVFILENYVKTIPEINKNSEVITKPNTLIINEIEYVNCDYILENAPIFSKGSKNSRMLVKNKNIELTNYIYARFENDKWNITDGKSIKFDKIFISKLYVDSIPELKQNNENEIIVSENGIEKAPEIIILEDNEKLKDNEGNVLDIEVRGMREVDKIYFKVKDVEKGFGMDYLYKTIIDNSNEYYIDKHYKYFLCENKILKEEKNNKLSSKEKVIKTLYLTYEGLLRVLFVSKNNKTTKFIKWAVNTLFTVHLGNEIQKDTLISKMKGVSYASIQELFNVNSKALPCVYLTYFNDVKTLRTIMNIEDKYNDTDCVYKFGLTTSFENRKYGHKQEFKDIENNIEFKLVQFAFIDPLYLSKAESDIKKLFEENIINYKNHSEIIVLSKKELQFIKNAYELIATKYSGHNTELLKENEKLNNDIKFMNLNNEQNILNIINEHKLKCENIIKENDIKCENIIKNKDIECNYKIELLKKDFEITLLKKELEYVKPVKSSKIELLKKK